MNSIQDLHQKAMALAEQAEIAKLRGAPPATVQSLLRSAFEQESAAAELTLNLEDIHPNQSTPILRAAGTIPGTVGVILETRSFQNEPNL
jgi:hypothetical protein